VDAAVRRRPRCASSVRRRRRSYSWAGIFTWRPIHYSPRVSWMRLKSSSSTVAHRSRDCVAEGVDGVDRVHLGNDGRSKGVVLSHENVLANIAGILARIEVGEDWRFSRCCPFAHVRTVRQFGGAVARCEHLLHAPGHSPGHRAVHGRLSDQRHPRDSQLLVLMLERIQQVAEEHGRTRLLERP